jgi:hypothetical protein
MADAFDPYREALVVETLTVWPDEFAHVPPDQRKAIEGRLHAEAQRAKQLDYVRLHAGFCRQITVTAEDMERLK